MQTLRKVGQIQQDITIGIKSYINVQVIRGESDSNLCEKEVLVDHIHAQWEASYL